MIVTLNMDTNIVLVTLQSKSHLNIIYDRIFNFL